MFTDKRLIVFAVFLLAVGCGYREIGPTGYEFAKALYSVCNQKSADRLDTISAQVVAASEDEQLNRYEARTLHAIIDDAQQGEWETAQRATRALMKAQVK